MYHFLESERLRLRPFEQADADFFLRWMNDPRTRGLVGESRPMSRDGAVRYIDRVNTAADRVWLAVVRKEDGKLVGETGLLRMNPDWRTTDLTIIIPDPADQRSGYGSEAVRLMLGYAFGHLGFHRVAIGVVGFNTQALGFYRKLGFVQEGVQQEGYFWDNRFHDFVMLRMLEREFWERE